MADPTCFISYSWDNVEHRDWVLRLAEDLQKNGIKVALDRYVEAGESLTRFMEASVRENDYVILVCTPNFAQKANDRTGGVGYETQVVSGEIFHGSNVRKFVPILRSGPASKSLPSYMLGKLAIDFRLQEAYQESLETLLRHIWNEPRYRRISGGSKPVFSDVKTVSKKEAAAEKATLKKIPQVDESSFESRVLKADESRASLVHFWATWCGPCRMVDPILSDIAKEESERLDIVGVDVDSNPTLARNYNVLSIPMMIAFRNGKERKQIIGARPKAALLNDLRPILDEIEEWKALNQDSLALTIHNGQIKVAVVRPDGTYSYLDSTEQRHGLLYLRTESAKYQSHMLEQFEDLLNDPYVTRSSLMRFLGNYPEFVANDEYRAAHSQVLLRHDAGTFAPNFVLQPMAGELCDLLEVEPPQHEIASVVNGVAMLSEVVLEAISRLRAYREYFEEERNRVRIQDEHGLTIFRPKMFVIIGRSKLLDPLSRRRLETSISDISLRTWDDVMQTARARLRMF